MSAVARKTIQKHDNDDSWNSLLKSTAEFLGELKEFHDVIQFEKEEEVNKPYIVDEEKEEEANPNA